MLRQEPNINPDQNKHSTPVEPVSGGSGGIDIQRELNRLEEMVLTSPHIPLTRRTLVDEERLLDQLDLVRVHLPSVFQEAQVIVQQKKEIILQAEQHAERIVQAAQVRAAQILNEMDIIQLAELEAKQIRQQVQQECEAQREQNLSEIELVRAQARQELEQMRSAAIAEAEEIQQGADEYADHVLSDIEQRLNDMLRIIRNGRQQLQQETHPDWNSSSSNSI